MRPGLVDLLRCPLCTKDLAILRAVEAGGEVQHGILGCGRHAFPLVGGIAYLRTGRWTARVVRLVEKEQYRLALGALLTGRHFPSQRIDQALSALKLVDPPGLGRLLLKINEGRARVLLPPAPTFCSTVDTLAWGAWGDYVKYRFSSPSFVATLSLVPALPTAGYLMDIGCGTGHNVFTLAKAMDPFRMVASDFNFTNLFLAQSFMCAGAQYLCFDANGPFPLTDASIRTVLCSDALHYIRNKKGLGREVERILASPGTVAMPHVHNALRSNPYPGLPLTPDGYRALLPNLEVGLLAERDAIEGFVSDSFPSPESHEGIEASPSLLLLAARGHSPWSPKQRPWTWYLDHLVNITLNPLFRAEVEGDLLRLHRSPPSSDYMEENDLMELYLAKEGSLAREVLGPTKQPLPAGAREALARFLVVDAPPAYA